MAKEVSQYAPLAYAVLELSSWPILFSQPIRKMKITQNSQIGSRNRQAANDMLLGWGIVALVFAVVACTFNNSALVLRAGFLLKVVAVVVGTGMGLLGAVIGDAIRRFAQPAWITTNGGLFSLVGIKLFWKLGPQAIGSIVGVMVGCALILR